MYIYVYKCIFYVEKKQQSSIGKTRGKFQPRILGRAQVPVVELIALGG